MSKNACATFILWSLLLSSCVWAQDDEFIIVEEVRIAGNKKTKDGVLERELPFRPGDTIALVQLVDKLAEGERQLMNTGLFTKAKITLRQLGRQYWIGSSASDGRGSLVYIPFTYV